MRNKNTIIALLVIFAGICAWNLFKTWQRFSYEGDLAKLPQEQQNKKLADTDYSGRYESAKRNSFSLGLDLQGGIFVTMEVGIEDMIRQFAKGEEADPNFEKAMKLAKEKKRSGTSDASLVDLFAESLKEVTNGSPPPLAKYFNSKDLDISYNTSDADVLAKLNDRASAAVSNTFTKIRTRVDQFGVTSPNLQLDERSGRILLELPGLKESDSGRVYALLRSTARLEFFETVAFNEAYPVFEDINREIQIIEGIEVDEKTDSSAAADTSKADSAKANEMAKADSVKGDSSALADSGITSLDSQIAANDTAGMTEEQKREKFVKENPFFGKFEWVQGRIQGDQPLMGDVNIGDTAQINRWLKIPKVKEKIPSGIKFLWEAKPANEQRKNMIGLIACKTDNGKPALDGSVITDARQDFDQYRALQAIVSMNMNSKGAKEWSKITKDNIGKAVAIVMDDLVYSYPVVQGQIPNGSSQITGNFTVEEAQLLANLLKAGSLPVRAEILGIDAIGPTLGAENLGKGMLSFVIAFVVTVGFLAFWYTGAGMIANVAMLLNLFFLLGVSAALNVVMTLPGIAAVVLTMGMAVDANVLIFERIREEQALGKSLKASIQAGFQNAFSSVMDSNITTFLTGVVLFAFGVGPIRGFAVTLMIGIVTSLICGLLITRILLEFYSNRGNESLKFGNSMSTRILQNVDLKMTQRKKMFYGLSGLIMALCVVSFVSFGFKTGVDFKGGYLFNVGFTKKVSPEELRGPLTAAYNNNSPVIKTVGTSNSLMITTSYRPEGAEDEQKAIAELQKITLETINKNMPGAGPKINNYTAVGPNVAADIRNSAIWSVIFSLLVIFSYILIRFRKWQFSVGAIAALFHDAILVLGAFSLLGHFDALPFNAEIDQTFIAALLTIIGYSINDTVVVYDRIRENMTEMKTSDMTKIFNTSLNQTFKRTMVTSFTTIVTTLILFFVGGEVTKGFMLAMFIGIVTGTYSSVFIASPLALDLDSATAAKGETAAPAKS